MKRQLVHKIAGGCLLVLCVILGIRFYQYHTARQEYEILSVHTVEEKEERPEADASGSSSVEITYEEKFRELKAQNPDTVAWVEISDTPIAYPVLYSGDNETYMHTTLLGEENPAGAIFLEQYNSPDFSDKTLFLYGHNMKDRSMFGSLKEYRDVEYLKEHPYIYLYTSEGDYTYEIFSVHRADTDTGTYTLFYEENAEYEAYLQAEKEASLYDTGVEVNGTEQVLILVTCTSDTQEGRFVVVGKLL